MPEQGVPMSVTITVNGMPRTIDVDPDKPLLWALREDMKLLGTKFGCGAGLCGACTVMMDGDAIRACQTPVGSIAGKAVTTIEHVATTPVLSLIHI